MIGPIFVLYWAQSRVCPAAHYRNYFNLKCIFLAGGGALYFLIFFFFLVIHPPILSMHWSLCNVKFAWARLSTGRASSENRKKPQLSQICPSLKSFPPNEPRSCNCSVWSSGFFGRNSPLANYRDYVIPRTSCHRHLAVASGIRFPVRSLRSGLGDKRVSDETNGCWHYWQQRV